jgi:deoxycytidine triphosphate deaminase
VKLKTDAPTIGQLLWFTASSEPMAKYSEKSGAKYTQRSALPQASAMHRNFPTRKP